MRHLVSIWQKLSLNSDDKISVNLYSVSLSTDHNHGCIGVPHSLDKVSWVNILSSALITREKGLKGIKKNLEDTYFYGKR